jgi:E3 ubiquitin-protein ligase HUWE1
MADRNKFEEMLERLVNEDKAGAEELFHEIVVEKSRDIYANLIESDIEIEEEDKEVEEATDEEVDEATDEEVDESSDEEVDESSDEEVDENFDLDEFEVEGEPEMPGIGGDAGDDMIGDIEMGGDEEGEEGEEELEDRVVDLEDALDDLKAEFEKMMGDDNSDEGDMDMDADGDDEAEEESVAFEATDEEVDESSDEEVEEAADEETDESTKSEAETMREYVEKVTAKMGDNGANTKSTVASANNMGGTASNLVAGGEADTKGTTGGLAAPSEKEDNAGNVNVPGGKAAKSNKAMPKGHGAEKKGAGDTAANKKPVIGG